MGVKDQSQARGLTAPKGCSTDPLSVLQPSWDSRGKISSDRRKQCSRHQRPYSRPLRLQSGAQGAPALCPASYSSEGRRRQRSRQAQLPESVTPVCISLTSSRCRSPPGLPRTTCRRSSRTRREATSPRPPGAPRRRRRDCMVQVALQGTSRDSRAERGPGTPLEAVRRAGQEAAGRRVRQKLLPPARRAPPCGPGPGRRAGPAPAGRIGHPGPARRPRRGHLPGQTGSWLDAKDL